MTDGSDDDFRQHNHEFDRPEADSLEQEMPVAAVPSATVPDADRVEPVDDADWAYADR